MKIVLSLVFILKREICWLLTRHLLEKFLILASVFMVRSTNVGASQNTIPILLAVDNIQFINGFFSMTSFGLV
mgnify:CR=1 FL=1